MGYLWKDGTNRRLRLGTFLVILGGLTVAAYITISFMIASGVRAAETAALRETPGDPVVALIAYVDTPSHILRERNRAVWALGQLGDRRALPVLEKYFTGEPCRHDEALCQRELAKAIRLCRGGVNPTAFLWRHGIAHS